MAFFKTIDEVRAYVEVSKNFNFATIQPKIKLAESRYILPLLGKVRFDDLKTKYDGTSLNTEEQALLDKLQLALAHLAFMLYIPSGNVNLSESGIHINVNENRKQAFEWQIRDLELSFRENGFNGLDDMLIYLEENRAAFTNWDKSDAYTIFKQHFIRTASEFSKHYNINNSRLMWLALRPVMEEVEEFTIKAVIGDALFDELKLQIKDDQVNADNQVILPWICKAVAKMTIAKGLSDLSIEKTVFGLQENHRSPFQSVKASQPARLEFLSKTVNEQETGAAAWLDKLRAYLNSNASATKYAAYFNSDLFDDGGGTNSGSAIPSTEFNAFYLT